MSNYKKKKLNLEQGVKYRGYGVLNEFGEFEFTPENTGSRQGRQKLVRQGDGWTLSCTKVSIICHLNLRREGNSLSRVKDLLNKTNEIIGILNDYEF